MNSDPVVIVDYDPSWPARFETERALVANALGPLAQGIEHFGSTAVPGLPAKPVIDLLVLVEQLEAADRYVERLKPLGYEFQDWPGELPEHLFFRKGSPRSHHLHLVLKGGGEHLRHIAFRDYLRVHPEVVKEYAQLKRVLAAQYGDLREGYTEAKTPFIRFFEPVAQVRLAGQPSETTRVDLAAAWGADLSLSIRLDAALQPAGTFSRWRAGEAQRQQHSFRDLQGGQWLWVEFNLGSLPPEPAAYLQAICLAGQDWQRRALTHADLPLGWAAPTSEALAGCCFERRLPATETRPPVRIAITCARRLASAVSPSIEELCEQAQQSFTLLLPV